MTNLSALSCTLSISLWSARRADKTITAETLAAHGAAADAGRWNKTLLSKFSLANLRAIASEARAEHYRRTVPLGETSRAMAGSGYWDYCRVMTDLAARFTAGVSDFCDAYPVLVDLARSELGTTFRADDYPTADAVAERFSFTWALLPLVTADAPDLWLALGADRAAQVSASIASTLDAQRRDASRAVWTRARDVVAHLIDRLDAYTRSGTDGGVFRDTLVTNIVDLVDLLPTLNVYHDPDLTALADRMRSDLCGDDARALRSDTTARAATLDRARALMASMTGVGAV